MEILFILAFIAIVLFNVLSQRAARRRQQEAEAEAAAPQAAAPAPEEPLSEDYWGRLPAAVAAPAAVLVPRPAPPRLAAAVPLSRRRHPLHALLRNKHELRRAVVLMTVLGPCRGQER